KNEQIQLPSFVRSTVSEANFSTTRSGLASQLLSLAIEIERPELEVRSSELTSQAESMTLQLDQLEQILLNVRKIFILIEKKTCARWSGGSLKNDQNKL
uniref:Dynein heavy chain ATP-binding dynein motor region domain-containing protein n=1 Tax=Acrobeloides nanus TaxID=290746 RepID=A0A914DFC8_9BILA